MQPSKVYFTDFRTGHEGLMAKLQRLAKTAGINQIDFNNKYVAIKLHFEEYGNLSFLRHQYAKALADLIKELGGKPFLTDCNTLYVGCRKDALEHLDTAYANGFFPFATGCQVLIADGLKGTDEAYVPVAGGEYIKEAKIGRAIMDADIIISLNHFKGHELAGFGGALKNLGMGCGSRAGKMEMHSSGKPRVRQEKCIGCKVCAKVCAHDAPQFDGGKATIDAGKCVGCGRCLGECPADAIVAAHDSDSKLLNYKIAEYTKAVVDGRPHFHLSLICDVSPQCDCHSENDAPIINDVGMLASFDPVALDVACADLCNAQPILPNSKLAEVPHHHDHFIANHPNTDWRTCVEHAEKLGIGTQNYELVRIK